MTSIKINFFKIGEFSLKGYPVAVLSFRLLLKAIAKPRYIGLCFWAFKQLSWVDRDIKQKAIAALKSPTKHSLPPLTPDLKQEIRDRVKAIFWTAKIHPVHPKCLHRSLALYHWLQEKSFSPKLEIGWGDDIGHAWVTYNGLVLNDRLNVAESMVPLTKFQQHNSITN